MTALLATVLAASVVGSVHCAGMCGGLVALAGADGATRRRALTAPAAWNAGRALAYVALGAAAGAVGAAVDVGGALAGVGQAAVVLAGAAVIVWGAVTLAGALGLGVPRPPAPRFATRAAASAARAVRPWPPIARAFGLGAVTACLPCGWLWAFVATAAGTGSPVAGMLVMATFWLGTVPLLLGLGVGAAAVTASVRRHVPAACAVLMIVVGLLAVAGRARPLLVRHDARAHPAAGVPRAGAPAPVPHGN